VPCEDQILLGIIDVLGRMVTALIDQDVEKG
jgi:hypothetical protein